MDRDQATGFAKRKPALLALTKGGKKVHGVSASDPQSIALLWQRIASALGGGPRLTEP